VCEPSSGYLRKCEKMIKKREKCPQIERIMKIGSGKVGRGTWDVGRKGQSEFWTECYRMAEAGGQIYHGARWRHPPSSGHYGVTCGDKRSGNVLRLFSSATPLKNLKTVLPAEERGRRERGRSEPRAGTIES